MKVAICSDGVFPSTLGGIQRHARMFVETLAREYPHVEIIAIHPHLGQSIFQGLRHVEEIAVASRPGKSLYAYECYQLSCRMAAVLQDFPDAVVYAEGLTGWGGASLLGPRMIVNPHGLEPFQGRNWLDTVKSWPLRSGLRKCLRHARFAISSGGLLTTIMKRLMHSAVGELVTIPNAVHVPPTNGRRHEARDGPLRFLFVGRFVTNKGIPDLLRAIELLTEAGSENEFVVDLVGSGPLFPRLAMAKRVPGVTFHGAVGDEALERFYSEADVFVLPTRFEGMPTVVLEAMARGLPIIVCDVGATRELVDSTNGFLIPPAEPAILAEVIRQCVNLPRGRLRELGNASFRKAATTFSWPAVVRAHMKLFEACEHELKQRRAR